MSRDGGEVASVLAVSVSTAGIGGVIVAVSEQTSRNINAGVGLLTITGILLTAATWLNKRWNKAQEQRIKEAIAAATRPIQPDANGGLSLTDLHKKIDDGFTAANHRMDRMEARQLAVQEQNRDMSERLDAATGGGA